MKTNLNKDINFSLQNMDNYKKKIDYKSTEIVDIYSKIITEYLRYIIKTITIKNNKISKFIISRGLNTITHVFIHLLYYTKNVDILYFHCEKAFYFYVEFVTQISEDDKTFLQLSSRDATNYVYKKTIFDINYEVKRTIVEETPETQNKLDIVNAYINIYKIFTEKLIHSEVFYSNNYTIHIDRVANIINLLNFTSLNIDDVTCFETICDALCNKISNLETFYDIIMRVVKKMIKDPTILKNIDNNLKNDTIEFIDVDSNYNNNPVKFINLLIH
jgi:hypothetical protein